MEKTPMNQPAPTLNQIIAERLGEAIDPDAPLTEEQAAKLGTALLHAAEIPCKIWAREDLEGCTDKVDEDSKEAVIAEVWNNRAYTLKNLADCTDADWDTIINAVNAAADELNARV
jgi:hypothetical protein